MSFCILLFAAVDCNDKASIAACIEGKVGFSLSLCVHLLHQPNWNIINNFASIWSYFGCVCSAKQKSTSNWLSHDMTPWIKLRVTDLIRFLNLKHTIRKFQFSWYKRNMLVFHLRYIAPILHFKSFEHATTIYFWSDFLALPQKLFISFVSFFLSFLFSLCYFDSNGFWRIYIRIPGTHSVFKFSLQKSCRKCFLFKIGRLQSCKKSFQFMAHCCMPRNIVISVLPTIYGEFSNLMFVY